MPNPRIGAGRPRPLSAQQRLHRVAGPRPGVGDVVQLVPGTFPSIGTTAARIPPRDARRHPGRPGSATACTARPWRRALAKGLPADGLPRRRPRRTGPAGAGAGARRAFARRLDREPGRGAPAGPRHAAGARRAAGAEAKPPGRAPGPAAEYRVRDARARFSRTRPLRPADAARRRRQAARTPRAWWAGLPSITVPMVILAGGEPSHLDQSRYELLARTPSSRPSTPVTASTGGRRRSGSPRSRGSSPSTRASAPSPSRSRPPAVRSSRDPPQGTPSPTAARRRHALRRAGFRRSTRSNHCPRSA